MHLGTILVYGVMVGASTIYGWIIAARLRRKARAALGENISRAQLTSIYTWMRVEAAEEKKNAGKLR